MSDFELVDDNDWRDAPHGLPLLETFLVFRDLLDANRVYGKLVRTLDGHVFYWRDVSEEDSILRKTWEMSFDERILKPLLDHNVETLYFVDKLKNHSRAISTKRFFKLKSPASNYGAGTQARISIEFLPYDKISYGTTFNITDFLNL